MPGAGAITSEGLLEIPQEGIFVAVPNGATNFEIKIIQKKLHAIPGFWQLKPAPKPITEKEYVAGKEEYQPKQNVYRSDKEFPGKYFEFLCLKRLEGIPIIHLILYLAQYKPLSKSLSVVETMTIEIGYDVPPQNDSVPHRRTNHPMLNDLILDSENVPEFTRDDDIYSRGTRRTSVYTFAVPNICIESRTHSLMGYEPVNDIREIPILKLIDII